MWTITDELDLQRAGKYVLNSRQVSAIIYLYEQASLVDDPTNDMKYALEKLASAFKLKDNT